MKSGIGNEMEEREHAFLSTTDHWALWFFCGVAVIAALVGFAMIMNGKPGLAGALMVSLIAMLIVSLIRTRATIRFYGRNLLDSTDEANGKKSD